MNPHTHQPNINSEYNCVASTSHDLRPLDTGYGTPVASQPVAEEDGIPDNLVKYFPMNSSLQRIARIIIEQDWFKNNTAEPKISSNDELVTTGGLNAGDSRFSVFHESGGKHRCLWFKDGKRCPHDSKRKDRATGHARDHFGYKPFICSGGCGKAGWSVFFCAFNRSFHSMCDLFWQSRELYRQIFLVRPR